MGLTSYKTVAGLLIFLVSIAAVYYPLQKKGAVKHAESLEVGEALASGIFLGAAFFHMLPDAIRLFGESYTFPVAEAICVASFLFFLFLERLAAVKTALLSKHTIPLLLTFILVIHSLVEGAALGLGSNFSDATMLLIAILAHKGSESFALCMILLKHELSVKQIIYLILFFALMTPLGIALGTSIQVYAMGRQGVLAEAILNAFAAGTFLYISTLHHIHAHRHEEDERGLLEFGCVAAGALTMGILAIWS